jgi:hypothetical protein
LVAHASDRPALGVDRGQHGRVVNGPLARLPGLDT